MENSRYPQSYGAWAGNPDGIRPDFIRCCERVTLNERAGFARSHQCRRPRGYGPDMAYCQQHDPDAVAKRKAKADARYRADRNKERPQWHATKFLAALRQIADGHNDARGLAQEIVSEYDKGAY